MATGIPNFSTDRVFACSGIRAWLLVSPTVTLIGCLPAVACAYVARVKLPSPEGEIS